MLKNDAKTCIITQKRAMAARKEERWDKHDSSWSVSKTPNLW